jgi:hypothetical protein
MGEPIELERGHPLSLPTVSREMATRPPATGLPGPEPDRHTRHPPLPLSERCGRRQPLLQALQVAHFPPSSSRVNRGEAPGGRAKRERCLPQRAQPHPRVARRRLTAPSAPPTSAARSRRSPPPWYTAGHSRAGLGTRRPAVKPTDPPRPAQPSHPATPRPHHTKRAHRGIQAKLSSSPVARAR